MAQADTGLGWNAKDTWLMSGVGQIATIPGGLHWTLSGYEQQQIPVANPTSADVVNAGFCVWDFISNRARYRMFFAANKPGAIAALFYTDFNQRTWIVFVPDDSYVIYSQGMEEDRYQGGVESRVPSSTYVGSDIVYYVSQSNSGGRYSTLQTFVPVFPVSLGESIQTKIETAYPYINSQSGAIFEKSNNGYAVACVANWYTQNGTLITSPVLISSDPSFVDMTCSVSQYNFAKANFLHNGLRFYLGFWDCVDQAFDTMLETPDLTQFGAAALSKVFSLLADESFSNIVVETSGDPYDPFGNTEEGGGSVDPDPEDDEIEEPPLPSMSFHNTGLCRIYRADDVALRQLASYMWTDDTFLQTLLNHAVQLIENPMDAIISLCMVPVAPPDLVVGTAEAVKVMFIPTPAAMWPVLNQFVRIDCGSLQLSGTYGSALDYNPYTKVSCFLPYIGFVDLDTDEVMGKTLSVVYRIDVVTGVCVAMIKVNGDVLYQFSGHCSIQMPLSSADFSGYFGALVEAGKLIAGTAAMAAGAPAVGGMLLDAPAVAEGGSTTSHKTIKTRNENTNRMRKAAEITETTERTPAKLSMGELARRQTANTVGAVMNSKYTIEHSGGFSGNSGYMGVRRPFIVVKRPNIANPEQYGQLNGRPSMIYMNLGSCTGYTEVQSVQLTGIVATNSELSEISTLLKSGVIF